MARPMLAFRLCSTSPKEWFGQSVMDIHDGDLWRYSICKKISQEVLHLLEKGEL